MCSKFHKIRMGTDKGLELGALLSRFNQWCNNKEVYVYCYRNPSNERNFSAIYENAVPIESAIRCEHEREISRAAAGLKMPSGFYISEGEAIIGSDLGYFIYHRIEYKGHFESLRGLVYEVIWFPFENRKIVQPECRPGYRYPWWLKS